jgi:hypothetical protein
VVGATWFDQQSSAAPALVYDVQPGTAYEYRIGAFCGTGQPVFSGLHTVTLPARTTESFANCSLVPDAQITNRQVLQMLQAGDVITAGNFPVKVDQVTGSGSFTGKGYVTVPFLGRAKVRVKFQGIQVNTEKQLIAGTVITTYDEEEGSIIDVDEGLDIFKDYQGIVSRLKDFDADSDIEDLKKVLEKLTEQAQKELSKEESDRITGTVNNLLEAKGSYDQIKTVYDALPEGDPLKESMKKDLDEASERFDEIKDQLKGIDKEAVSTDKYILSFRPVFGKTSYAVDAHDNAFFSSKYEVEEHGGEKYFIAWKAVAEGESDWVSAYTENLPENVVFRCSAGELQSERIGDVGADVKVYGTIVGATNQVIAYQEKEIDGKRVNTEIGKLNVVSYSKQYRKLILVQVNDTPLPGSIADIEAGLNKIYNKALVYWKVESRKLTSNYDPQGNGLADDMNIIVTGRYTTEMNHIIRDYASKESTNADDHYLFLVPRSESHELNGVNLYQHQAGFIFMEKLATLENFNWVIAHEIGHGAFRLYHTFDDEPASKTKTDNLMDYTFSYLGVGTGLYKFQWDRIHEPVAMLPLFEDEEQHSPGAVDETTMDVLLKVMARIENDYTDSTLLKLEQDLAERAQLLISFDARVMKAFSTTVGETANTEGNDLDQYIIMEEETAPGTDTFSSLSVAYKTAEEQLVIARVARLLAESIKAKDLEMCAVMNASVISGMTLTAYLEQQKTAEEETLVKDIKARILGFIKSEINAMYE